MADSDKSSSRSQSRLGYKTPPPPPVRSSSKGVADIPPIPARNYGPQEAMPRYTPAPGLKTYCNFSNISDTLSFLRSLEFRGFYHRVMPPEMLTASYFYQIFNDPKFADSQAQVKRCRLRSDYLREAVLVQTTTTFDLSALADHA